MTSGYTAAENRSSIHGTDVAYDVGRVVDVPPHEPGDANQHIVKVQLDSTDPKSAVWCTVATTAIGDITMPIEGDIVRVGYEKGERPLVEGIRYRAQDAQADERLVRYGPGHRRISGGDETIPPPKDGHLEIFPDGTVELLPAPGKPLILGGSGKTVFLHEDFTYPPDESFYPVKWDAVETRLLSQTQLDEWDISSTEDVQNLPQFDEQFGEWITPKVESEWREPDPRGSVWSVSGCIRFELVQQGTVSEVGLFIREKGDSLSAGQLVATRTVSSSNQSANEGVITVPFSFRERFPEEARLSIHVRSVNGGGTISSNPLTVNGSPRNITSNAYGPVEMWDRRFPRVRQTYMTFSRS